MKIIVKDVSELTPKEYAKCSEATLGARGMMQENLEWCRAGIEPDGHECTGKAIMLYRGITSRSKLIGWVLIFPVRSWGGANASEWNRRKSKYSAMFFVDRKMRGKGYGTMLMNEVYKFDARPHVYPWNYESGGFFENKNVSVDADDRDWIKLARDYKPRRVA